MQIFYNNFILYITSFLLGLAGAKIIHRYAGILNLVDFPNGRSSHTQPTPRAGGIGIVFAFITSSIALDLSFFFWAPITGVAFVAFLEVRYKLSIMLRLCMQLFLVFIFLILNGLNPLTTYKNLIVFLFYLLFIVGTANYYNFMDGINGIAGITGIVGFGALSIYVLNIGKDTNFILLSICVLFACLGFLPFNIFKAKVFMGDVGSIFLGSFYAILVFMLAKSILDFVVMASFIFPFYADEIYTMFLRIKNKENLLSAHRNHLYQVLANEMNIPHWKVSIGFGLSQVFICISMFIIEPFGIYPVIFTNLIFFSLFILFYIKVRHRLGLI